MDYTSMLSLGNMALVAIVVSFWTEKDSLNSIYWYFLNLEYSLESKWVTSDETWQRIADKVSAKISHLPLPKTVQLNVRGCVRPIGFQFLKFLNLCSEFGIKVERCLLNDLCWSSIGTVDVKKTAKCLIKNEDLDICKRYELACVYCLEKEIHELWHKIPTVRSKAYYSKYVRVFIPNKLALLWAYDMKGELARLVRPIAVHWLPGRPNSSPYQFAFEYSAKRNNLAATEFFLRKLTASERNESLVRVAGRKIYRVNSEIFCFLMSQMDDVQKNDVYQCFPDIALVLFLEWPFQKLFMQFASNVRMFLSSRGFEHVLRKIVIQVRYGYTDYDYQSLFRSFWLESPNANKQGVISMCIHRNISIGSEIIADLSEIKDWESIALLLRYVIEEMPEERIICVIKYQLSSLSNENLLKLYFLCLSFKFLTRGCKKELLKDISTLLKWKTW